MVEVVWTDEAAQDREDIATYKRQFDVVAAVRIDNLFEVASRKLARFPNLGRHGLVAKTPEFIPHENYRMVYQIIDDDVHILTIIHVARQWPPVEPD